MAGRDPTVTDTEIAVEMYLSDDPVFVASEVADMIDMSRQGALDRLKKMEQRGTVHSKIPGRDRIFWLSDSGRKEAREHLTRRREFERRQRSESQ